MAVILTSNGDEIIVDDDMYDQLSKYKWCLTDRQGRKYVIRWCSLAKRNVRIHRIIMGLERGDDRVVDHINGNPLDNRTENLRICTKAENVRNQRRTSRNKSGFKGVTWHKSNRKFVATITHAGKTRNLGCFESPELAHEFYCLAADMLHGEFANYG